MKTMKNLKSIVLFFALFVAISAFAGNEKAVIKTSAQCEMCKEALETSIGKLPGVLKVNLDIDSKELMVKYDSDVISLEKMKTEVTYTGYWADEMAPDKEAYSALPSCCKPKKSCCASKSSCSKDGEKKECAKDGEKKECSKDGANAGEQKKSCSGHAH